MLLELAKQDVVLNYPMWGKQQRQQPETPKPPVKPPLVAQQQSLNSLCRMFGVWVTTGRQNPLALLSDPGYTVECYSKELQGLHYYFIILNQQVLKEETTWVNQ